MVLSGNAVMRESEFNFYTQCLSKWTLLVEAAAAGITGSPGGYTVIWVTIFPVLTDTIFFSPA